jgi:tol-pal system protein YbgF
MNKIITASALALAILSSTAAPAGAQNRAEIQMAAELRMLQEQTQQLALTLAQLGEAIKAINARIDASSESTRKGFADQDQRLKNMGEDLSVLREGSAGTSTRLGELKDEVEAMRSSLTSLPALLAQYAAPPAAVDPADPNAAGDVSQGVPPAGGAASPASPFPPPAPVQSTLGLSPTRMYQTAYADYQSGQYSVAISGFESFLRQFPQTELSDDAYVYMGESYFLERKFDQAIASYDQAIRNFPSADQIPLAYYKRGLAYSELGQVEQARASWEQLMKLYPNSTETILAKAGLDRVNRQSAPRVQ